MTLDSGATVSFIILPEATRLGMKIHKASQLVSQADGETKLHVIGEVHDTLIRGDIKFSFNALVVRKLNDASILAGMNFLIENKISQEPFKHRITVQGKYYIEETPSRFIYPSEFPVSKTVTIKRISPLLPNDIMDIELPKDFPPNARIIVDSSDQANNNREWLCQEVLAVNRSIKIKNASSKPILLGKNKDTSVIKIRPVTQSPQTVSVVQSKYNKENQNMADFKVKENTLEYVKRINKIQYCPQIPSSDDKEKEYLKKIYIEPGIMNDIEHEKLWGVLKKYHEVFDNDIAKGYNNASGEFDVDWNWLNDQQPPPGVSKQEVYANDKLNQLKQDKIDWMESQNICFKAHLLGVPIKYASLTMLIPKASFKDHQGPTHHGLFRFVNLFNQLNEYIKLEPSQPESISSVLYEAGQWNYMISGDLTNSFYQRWIAKNKLPYMAFHSPYKGMYVLARSAQGMKNQSEGLDQMLKVILGDLIKQGRARKIADDIQAGGQTVNEAIENFGHVLEAFQKNNIKIDPNKTKIFAKRLPIFGWIKEGQHIKPDDHRILAIEKSQRPKTVTELRSYLGSYKVFYKHMPKMSVILDQLQQITGEKNSKAEIKWTDSLIKAFEESKAAIKNVQPLYLPKRSDQLAITLDWSEKGIGATLWALLKNKKEIVCFFSSPLKGGQSKWPPCDGEGLAVCSAIDRFSNYIRESYLPTLICSDNKPAVQAALLLSKGIFSSSPRLNKLLSNCNTYPISFHHLSGKLALNEESDIQSRNPSTCNEPNCPVCVHMLEQANILDDPIFGTRKKTHKFEHIDIGRTFLNKSPCNPDCHTCNFLQEVDFDLEHSLQDNISKEALCSLQIQDILKGEKAFPYLNNRKILIQVQRNDPVLSKLRQNLQSGNRPTSRNTKSNDLKTYLGFDPKLDHDGLITVERMIKPHLINTKVPVIPPNFAKSILLAAHLKMGHPKPTQLEKLVSRSFCSLRTKNLIKELFNNCYTCQADLTIPKEQPNFVTETKPQYPGAYWSCDVMKHGNKNIMVCTDNFSSFTVCTFINSEKQLECENAIVSLIFPFKAASGEVNVRVDTAPGLTAMINHSSQLFQEAGIFLEPGDAKNKNSLAKVDKTMAELRGILRTISTDGSMLSVLSLQKAVNILNLRIRSCNLSAREIMFSRLQDTNANIVLNDKTIAKELYDKRLKANEYAANNKRSKPRKSVSSIQKHSLVFLKQDSAKDKSKVRDLYIVMEIDDDKQQLYIQKMLNPITDKKANTSNSKQYRVKFSDVYFAPSQHENAKIPYDLDDTYHSESETMVIPKVKKKSICKYFSLDTDQEDDFDFDMPIVKTTSKVIGNVPNAPNVQEIDALNSSTDTQEQNVYNPIQPFDFSNFKFQPIEEITSNVSTNTNKQLSIWLPPNTSKEQVALSPIIRCQDTDLT